MSDEVVSKLTYYNGYIFRSLLEAKWAILFDYLKIQYQYESQRFDTKYGWYLPDFHLKNVNLWIEIKPKFPSSEAIDKIQTVADQTNCFACILVSFPEIDLFGEEWQPTQSFVFLFSPGSKKSAHISINQIYNFIFNSPINKNKYFMASCLTTAIYKAKAYRKNELISIKEILLEVLEKEGFLDRYSRHREINESKLSINNELSIFEELIIDKLFWLRQGINNKPRPSKKPNS